MLGIVQSGSDSATALLTDVSSKHPSWAKDIDSFVEAAEEDNAIIAKFAATEVDPVHLAKFRAARVAPMLASAARNVDGVVTSGKAKFAPTTTDNVESGYGTLDQVVTCTGVVQLANLFCFGSLQSKW